MSATFLFLPPVRIELNLELMADGVRPGSSFWSSKRAILGSEWWLAISSNLFVSSWLHLGPLFFASVSPCGWANWGGLLARNIPWRTFYGYITLLWKKRSFYGKKRSFYGFYGKKKWKNVKLCKNIHISKFHEKTTLFFIPYGRGLGLANFFSHIATDGFSQKCLKKLQVLTIEIMK